MFHPQIKSAAGAAWVRLQAQNLAGLHEKSSEADGPVEPQPLRATTGSGLGALAGLLGGAAWGAYDPGAVAVLNEKGKPKLQRRNRLAGAIRTAVRGSAIGGLGGAAIGGLANDILRKPINLPEPPIPPALRTIPPAKVLPLTT
jgi:MFS family permease